MHGGREGQGRSKWAEQGEGARGGSKGRREKQQKQLGKGVGGGGGGGGWQGQTSRGRGKMEGPGSLPRDISGGLRRL